MSSYVYFNVKDSERLNEESVVLSWRGRSSFLYQAVHDACGYVTDEKEYSDKNYNETLSYLKRQIEDCEKSINIYEDCMKNCKEREDIFDFAEGKQNVLEIKKELEEDIEWLKFYFYLDCKKYILFD